MEEQTIEKEQSHLRIGDYLKKKREDKGYTLKVISQHTKINATLLDKLERNRLEELPSKAYVAGFVKSYAKTLGLDEEETLEILNQSYLNVTPEALSAKSPLTREIHSQQRANAKSESSEGTKLIAPIIVIGVALVLVVTAFISNQSDSPLSEQESQEEKVMPSKVEPKSITATTPLKTNSLTQVSNDSESETIEEESVKLEANNTAEVEAKAKKEAEAKKAAEAKAKAEKEAVEKKAEKEAEAKKVADAKAKAEKEAEAKKVADAKAKAEKEAEAKKAEAKKAEEDKNKVSQETKKEEKPKVEFKLIPTPMFSYDTKHTEAELSEWLPKQFANSTIEGKENIYINAVEGDSWLTYKSDNDDIKKFILRKGRSVLIRGSDVRIFLGNTKVTRIFYNNKLINPHTDSGVKSLVFPTENVAKLKIPLFIYRKDGTVITSEEYMMNP